jgi:hypothetical protein
MVLIRKQLETFKEFISRLGSVETANSGKHQDELYRGWYRERVIIIRPVSEEVCEVFCSHDKYIRDIEAQWNICLMNIADEIEKERNEH